jgi:acyl-[acyl-carrier-protein]-phospholipid O-acyltransferase/long-chain-fatty-acid--[acyl-carrier-protein] ligase
LTTKADAAREDIMRHAKAKHASDMMIPAEIIILDKLPLLATGKPDYPAIAELVKARGEKKASGLAA